MTRAVSNACHVLGPGHTFPACAPLHVSPAEEPRHPRAPGFAQPSTSPALGPASPSYTGDTVRKGRPAGTAHVLTRALGAALEATPCARPSSVCCCASLPSGDPSCCGQDNTYQGDGSILRRTGVVICWERCHQQHEGSRGLFLP